MRDRRGAPLPLAGLLALLCATGLLGVLALSGGWALGAALWGADEGAPAGYPVPAALRLGPSLGLIAQASATPTPLPTATPTPAPPPPPRPILATRRLVTYYGNPLAGVMGVLGEQSPEPTINRLRQQALPYEADGRPVQPALHLIATVAQAAPGDDGLYRLRMAPELIEEWVVLAQRHELLLILDVQVGRGTVQEEVAVLRPYLERQHVQLALDPEFAMSPTTVPGRQIGSMSGADVSWAIDFLAEIARAQRHTENKVLIVHQFTDTMIRDRDAIALHDRVDFTICMDGFAAPATKIAQYQRYVATDPVQYAAIKLFYQHDLPLMSPADVLALDPTPDIVVYQ